MDERQREAVAKVQSQLALLRQLLEMVKPSDPKTAEALGDARFHLRAAARALADVGPGGISLVPRTSFCRASGVAGRV